MSRPGYSASATISAAWARSRLVARFTMCANKLRSAASMAGQHSTVRWCGAWTKLGLGPGGVRRGRAREPFQGARPIDLGQKRCAGLLQLFRADAGNVEKFVR